MADVANLQAKLQVLNDAYAAQLPEKLKQLEKTWVELPRDTWDEAGFETLHRMVHSLTGSGKTFGFSLLSDVARNLEGHLKQLAKAKTAFSEEQREQIQVLLRDLHAAAIRRDSASGNTGPK